MGFIIKPERRAASRSSKHKHDVSFSIGFLVCCLVLTVTFAWVLGRGCHRSVRESVAVACGHNRRNVSSSTQLESFGQTVYPSHSGFRDRDKRSSAFDQWFHEHEKQWRLRTQLCGTDSRRQKLYFERLFEDQRFSLRKSDWSEALVHPAMLAHVNPKRIAVIGQEKNTKSTLREVLKHDSVETVIVVVEEDGDSIGEEFQDRNEQLKSSSAHGAKDRRVKHHKTKNAASWVIDHCVKHKEEYDVVFLEPGGIQQSKPGALCDTSLLEVLLDILRDDGILVAYTSFGLPARNFGLGCDVTGSLQKEGFEYITEYSEARVGFTGTHNFLIAFMDRKNKHRWYLNQAEIDLGIRKRFLSTFPEEPAFDLFDSSTMMTYQYPSRLVEERFCTKNPTPTFCDQGHGLDPERSVIPITDLNVMPSTIPNAGRGLFATKSLPKNSYLAAEEQVRDILFMPTAFALLDDMMDYDHSGPWKLGYAFASMFYGLLSWSVDPSIMCFVNHGCNGTYNINERQNATEMSADPRAPPVEDDPMEEYVYNPFLDRNHLIHMHAYDITNDVIEAGAEVLGNYVTYADTGDWKQEIEQLRAQCLGQAVGEVIEYEQQYQKIHRDL